MTSAPMRALLGFIAAVLAVLIFHQGMVALIHSLGGTSFLPYRTSPVPPWGVPQVADLCFWGGVYGVIFGLLAPRFTLPMWLCGLILGIIAALVGMFVVAPLKHLPIAAGGQPWPIARSLLINGFWGLGVGLILPLLMPRSLARAHT